MTCAFWIIVSGPSGTVVCVQAKAFKWPAFGWSPCFEQQLLDNDVYSNWGNWAYVAGAGQDPRDRVFNPERQASMYDPQGKYQRRWLGSR